MSAIEPLDTWISVQCDEGRHTACRPQEWSCQCSCHHGVAAVASDDPVPTDPCPASPAGSSDGAAAAVPSPDDIAEGSPASAGVRTSGEGSGAADVRALTVKAVVGEVDDHTRGVARGSTP